MAIKGAVRQTIVLRCVDSEMFEAAYFVVKQGKSGERGSGDMLREANRIVSENTFSAKAKRYGAQRRLRLRSFAFGALCGGGAVGVLWFVLALIF